MYKRQVLDSTPAEDASNVQTELLTESDLTGAFTQDGAADAVRGLVYGEAAACLLYTSRCV